LRGSKIRCEWQAPGTQTKTGLDIFDDIQHTYIFCNFKDQETGGKAEPHLSSFFGWIVAIEICKPA
jgi:hypothetical protein